MTQLLAQSAENAHSRAAWLPHRTASVPAARDLLRNFLAAQRGGERWLHAGLLVLSELVCNAVQHARVPRDRLIQVRFELASGFLRIEVHDASTQVPQIQAALGEDESGRGLCLVQGLASEWGYGPRLGVGKLVWALVAPEGGIRS
ncbi:ATP-binding protein [Kitasatospora sp. NPDC052896]|uniref:ATP-binding protein n=1 Tax=Kitasatospora sp. NPDC052896 TaxID=3364061 RepID=UPI0037C82984